MASQDPQCFHNLLAAGTIVSQRTTSMIAYNESQFPAAMMLKSIIANNKGAWMTSFGFYSGATEQCMEALELLRPVLRRHLDQDINMGNSEQFQLRSGSQCSQTNHYSNLVEQTDVDMADILAESSESSEDTTLSTDERIVPTSPLHYTPTRGILFREQWCRGPEKADKECTVSGSKLRNFLDQAGCFVYPDPIEIPVDVVTESHPSKQFYLKAATIMLYNAALSFHFSAISEEFHTPQGKYDSQQYPDPIQYSENQVKLERAKLLYELAFQLHIDYDCGVSLLYSMALLNNLGLMYRHSHETHKSLACFGTLLSTMMHLLDIGQAQKTVYWDGFWSNLSPLAFRRDSASAA